jgi:hypothetical protein
MKAQPFEKMIQLQTNIDGSRINFYWSNRVYLGYAYKEVDGFYVFIFDESNKGCWAAYILSAVADKLDELNRRVERTNR